MGRTIAYNGVFIIMDVKQYSVSWSYLKKFIDAIETPSLLNYFENWNCYDVWIEYQGKVFESCISKEDCECTIDFETNYKPFVKKKVSHDGFVVARTQFKESEEFTYFTSSGDDAFNNVKGDGPKLLFEFGQGTPSVVKIVSFITNIKLKDLSLQAIGASFGDNFTIGVVCPSGSILPSGQIAVIDTVVDHFVNSYQVYGNYIYSFLTEDSIVVPQGYRIMVTGSNISNTAWKALVNLKLYRY